MANDEVGIEGVDLFLRVLGHRTWTVHDEKEAQAEDAERERGDCVDDGEAGTVAGEMFATITGNSRVDLFIVPAREMEARGQTPCIVFHRDTHGEIDGLSIGTKRER